jgi:hypothetical protein
MPRLAIGPQIPTEPREQVLAALRLLHEPGAVIELRVLDHPRTGSVTSGYFTDSDALASAALAYSGVASGCYITMNQLNPALLARRCNRVQEWAKQLTCDGDVLRRRWLLVDLDPVRPSGISSTKDEFLAAIRRSGVVRNSLAEQGWPEPAGIYSGNGVYLYYCVDLPADDGGLVEGCLKALAARFDDAAVKVDQKVFNPARITELPGTLTRKGDNTTDQPHRPARLYSVPEQVVPVTAEQLEALAALAPAPGANHEGDGHANDRPRLNVARWLGARGLAYRLKEGTAADPRTKYRLTCPFDPSHEDAAVMQAPDGRLSAHCFHSSCAGRGWQEFKQQIGPPGPDHYDGATAHKKPAPAPRPVSAADLVAMDLPDIRFAVPDLVPEGATILAAPPKTGKSFLVLSICVAVASGGLVLGSIRVERGTCLYLALEDGPRRMRRRLGAMLSAWGGAMPQELYLAHEWPRPADGGIDEIEHWLQEHPDCRLVVIDTLARMRDRRASAGDLYADDYEAIARLQRLALKYGVGVVIVHHTRKSRGEGGDLDQLETVSGTMGLTGAADAVLVLRRKRQERHGRLFVTGRDLEERELPLTWDPGCCHWEVSAPPSGPDADLTPERRIIRQAVRDKGEPVSIPEAVAALRRAGLPRDYDAVAKLLNRMVGEGFLEKDGRGLYKLPKEGGT